MSSEKFICAALMEVAERAILLICQSFYFSRQHNIVKGSSQPSTTIHLLSCEDSSRLRAEDSSRLRAEGSRLRENGSRLRAEGSDVDLTKCSRGRTLLTQKLLGILLLSRAEED
ncbi:hypothetical protein Tco_0777825 [Tanacetum coccineum]